MFITLWWWFHECMIVFKSLKLYALNMCHFFVYSYTSVKIFFLCRKRKREGGKDREGERDKEVERSESRAFEIRLSGVPFNLYYLFHCRLSHENNLNSLGLNLHIDKTGIISTSHKDVVWIVVITYRIFSRMPYS